MSKISLVKGDYAVKLKCSYIKMANILEKLREQIIAKVNYEHVRTFLTSVVSAEEDTELRNITNTSEQMTKLLDMVASRPTAGEAFIASLEMCDQRKIYGDLSNKLLMAKLSK